MKLKMIVGCAVSILSLTACNNEQPGVEVDSVSPTDVTRQPNLLLIVADDLGFADIGVHGSRIKTPNLDALAGRGTVFSQFHTAPMCAPTRTMLLSGNNNHIAGIGNQLPSKILDNTPGFEHHLSDRIVPFPKLLQEAGYNT